MYVCFWNRFESYITALVHKFIKYLICITEHMTYCMSSVWVWDLSWGGWHAHTWWSQLLVQAQCIFVLPVHLCGSAESTKATEKCKVTMVCRRQNVGWMDWDGGLTWPAPKNSCLVLAGDSTKTLSRPQRKRTYLYMLVLRSSWACGSGQESAHCWSSHCSSLSCWALVRCSRTGHRAPCPVQISTSSKRSMTSGPD